MLVRKIGFITLALGAVLPLAAQQRQPARARIWVDGREMSPLDLVVRRRARLGVVVDMNAMENDSIGATISSVTPGGPAGRAGMQAGDIITRVDGESLVDGRRGLYRDLQDAGSTAALRLIEMVARLDPGDTAKVEYRRGKETRTAMVVADREPTMALAPLDDSAFVFRFPEQGGRFKVEDDLPTIRFRQLLPKQDGAFAFKFGGPFADLELAPLNPDLGTYFGTAEGVLVIDAPRQNSFGLKGGDVILSVDGREPRGPASLLRILRSYEPGESVKLEIMRNRTRQTVSAKIDRDDE
jgi:S1-C subfamily serine protease